MSMTVAGERYCVRHNQSERNIRCRNHSPNCLLRLEMQKENKTLNVVQNEANAVLTNYEPLTWRTLAARAAARATTAAIASVTQVADHEFPAEHQLPCSATFLNVKG